MVQQAHSKSVTHKPDLNQQVSGNGKLAFKGLLAGGLIYTGASLFSDISNTGEPVTTYLPFLLLAIALLVALGFEFVNGFHDTANAVATVIYTHSLPPHFAVIWSGIFNFLGVMVSSGAVAFSIISLLPVELILQVGSKAGFAMVFALLCAAILWNLGTWWVGLPASSSHTLIGSIIGVGITNALMHGHDGTSGVDWNQAAKVGYSLLLSPFVGFCFAALLLMVLRVLIRNRHLYEEPKSKAPPPWWIRGILILTCTGVSFAHGSNDGQKGMGLIMLILVGTVPLTYALNRSMSEADVTQFVAMAQATSQSLEKLNPAVADENYRDQLTEYLRTKTYQPGIVPAIRTLSVSIADQVRTHSTLSKLPALAVPNVRNDMYLCQSALKSFQVRASKSFQLMSRVIGWESLSYAV